MHTYHGINQINDERLNKQYITELMILWEQKTAWN